MPDLTGITPDLMLPLLIIWLAPAIWIYLDVRLRGGRAIVWATEWLIASAIALAVLRPLIWLPANALGLVVYLFVRPNARVSLPNWRTIGGGAAPLAQSASAPEPSNGQPEPAAANGAPPAARDREEVDSDR